MTHSFDDNTWLTTPWSQDDPEHPRRNPIFRKSLTLTEAVATATLHISGVGHYELYINGTRVGDRMLEPAFTNYDKRVLYSTYEIAGLLTEGENVFSLYLGRGRYNMNTVSVWAFELSPWRDTCAFITAGEMTTTSGQTIPLNTTDWTCTEGPIFRDSMYGGEGYDARMEPVGWQTSGFDDSTWEAAVPTKGPAGTLWPDDFEPIRIVKRMPVAKTVYADAERVIYDFGDMIAGDVEISVEEPAGTQLHLAYSEKFDGAQIVIPQNHVKGSYFQEDAYICRGGGEETWHARFSYKGFRYIEISGFSGTLDEDQVTALVMHNDVQPRGHFECSNALINKLHEASTTALLNNLHHTITDTPTYEKNGWTGDAQLTAPMGLYNFQIERFYRNYLNHIRDAQIASGELALIVPTSGWGLTDNPNGKRSQSLVVVPAWDAALFIMAWEMYQFSGKLEIIAENYPAMQKYISYLGEVAEDYIVDAGLGDWLPPNGDPANPKPGEPSEGPSISSTAWYYKLCDIMCKCATLLEDETEQAKYRALKSAIYTAFNKRFLNETKDGYTSGIETEYRQTSSILPLAFDLVPDQHKTQVLAALKQDICKDGYPKLNAGILGTRYVFDVLADYGEVDLAYALITSRQYPSWGFWFDNGYVSLAEMWELTSRSWSHHMFGSVDAWFYRYLAGIAPASPGFKQTAIAPHIPAELEAFSASVELPAGKISSSYQKQNGEFIFDIELPAGCRGLFTLPAGLPSVTLGKDFTTKGLALKPGENHIIVNQSGEISQSS